MTLTITMCTPGAIYMITDSLMVDYYSPDTTNSNSPIEKTKVFQKQKILLSLWGTTGGDDFNLFKELEKIEEKLSDTDGIDSVSEKIKIHFEKIKVLDSEDELGFHLAGYSNNHVRLNHVFHTQWLKQNQFINEDCTRECHAAVSSDPSAQIIGFKRTAINNTYPILFNGDNKIPNLLLNGFRAYGERLNYPQFDEKSAKEFLILMMDTAINMQVYSQKKGIIGYPLMLSKISQQDKISTEFISEPLKNSTDGRFFDSLKDASLTNSQTNN